MQQHSFASEANFNFDRNKPIEIAADKLIVTDNQKKGQFLGNVQVTQDAYRLKANRILVDYTEKKDEKSFVKKISAFGSVYLFSNQTQAAKADKMTYDLYSKDLILSGQVMLTYNNNILTGDKIILNTQTNNVTVESKKAKRIKALIYLPSDN